MNVWSRYPFLRYSIFLILGILIGKDQYWIFAYWWILLLLFVALTLVIKFNRNVRLRYFIRGLILSSVIFYFGSLCATLDDDRLKSDHYINFQNIEGFQIRIISDHNDRTKYLRYQAEILKISNEEAQVVSGEIFLYVRKDTTRVQYNYGDILNVVGNYYPIPPPQNPHEFNYKKYLASENIYAHSFVGNEQIDFIVNNPPNKILHISYQIRSWARDLITRYIDLARERSVIQALVLGIKDYLDNDLKSSYSAAGAMHVLAVSGLHVGIVYKLIVILFSFIKRIRFGYFAFLAITLMSIWLYALVTGFTPSVLRASVMFTVILFSEHTGQKSNIYNALGIAAFILLLMNPNYIFSVGFQLSFIAVFGIVFLHPILYRQLYFKSKIADYLWSITCVSLAAQAATFPLTVYYFHQFPTYFLVSNLVVIPAAMFMLVLGLLMLITGGIPIAAQTFGWILTKIVWLVNELIFLLQDLPKPIIDWLYFDGVDTFLVYAVLLFLALGLSQQNAYKFIIGVSLLIVFNFKSAKNTYESYKQEKLIFYEIQDHIVFDIVTGQRATLYINNWNEEESEKIGFQINPNRLASMLQPVRGTWVDLDGSELLIDSTLGKILLWKGYRILFYEEPKIEFELNNDVIVDIIYLNATVKELNDKIKASTIVLGPDYKKWHIENVQKSHPDSKLHSLVFDGYFEL